MSGYNRIEQIIGGVLTRFPRLKSVAETGYQRANYHLFADRDFEYELHESAEFMEVDNRYGDGIPDDHFVGFYDVSPWNASMDSYFVHRIDDGRVSIGVLTGGKTKHVTATDAWNYQQGSRTQWHPTEDGTLLYNDVEDGSAVGRSIGIDGTINDTYPYPIQAVRPAGGEFLSIDYRRLDRNSPGYGYGTDDGSLRDPGDDGIFRVDLEGDAELIVPFEELLDSTPTDVPHGNHYIHHVLYAPDGDRFAFLHRWMDEGERNTRLLVSDRQGDRRTLLENRHVSHFCWLDGRRLFLWGGSERAGRGYHVLDVVSGESTPIDGLEGYGDGHPSLSPDGSWIVTDTYPDRLRKRTLTLYHLPTEREIRLGTFFSPFGFDGSKRCDLHPRWSPDGQFVSIDSAHGGRRRSYIVDVGSIV